MRKQLAILLILFVQTLSAQLVRFEFGAGFLINSQSGIVFAPDVSHTTLWYDEIDVERRMWQPTFSVQLYYPINFGTLSYERFSIGIQTGLAYGLTTPGRVFDQVYLDEHSVVPLRIPLMMLLRTGSCNELFRKKSGLVVGGGLEIVSLSFADEYGKFLVPVVHVGLGIKRSTTSLIIFPEEITSTYLNDGVESKRLSNKLIEFRFSLAIECTPKRYRRTKKS